MAGVRSNISSQRINKTLKELRSALPPDSALNQLSLTALGNRIAIREGQTLRESETGQYALALEIVEEKGRLRVITRQDEAPAPDAAAEDHYAKGVELEEVDPQAARSAYEAALAGVLCDEATRARLVETGRAFDWAAA